MKRIRNVQMATPSPSCSRRVTPALLCHESPLSQPTMLIQPVPSCICSIREFFLWVCQYPRLLHFRGHCGSDNRIFIYRTWMKFGKSLHSIINSLGLKYFLCVVFKDCQVTGLSMRFLHVHSRTQHTRDHFSLMPLCISKTWQCIILSPAYLKSRRTWNI